MPRESRKEGDNMAENPYNDGRLTNKGTQAIPAVNKRPSTPASQKKRGNDLRAGKGKK